MKKKTSQLEVGDLVFCYAYKNTNLLAADKAGYTQNNLRPRMITFLMLTDRYRVVDMNGIEHLITGMDLMNLDWEVL